MKTKRFCVSIFLLCGLLFSNCSKEELENEVVADQRIIDVVDDVPRLCTELHGDNPARAFGSKSTFWRKEVLRVRFLGGSEYVQNKVKQYATQWSAHANIRFEFVDAEPSDIRISFDTDSGSWSYVGRSNQFISPQRATMNFGWFNNRTSDTEFRRTTLHEFGHAIGLSHEHQHPQVDIDWNREAVYAYYQRTQDWTRSDVDGNIFRKYSAGNSNFSSYDPASIMHYYIPRSLVQGAWNPTWNTRLSATDIAFIGEVYPGTAEEEVLSCNCPDDLLIVACEDFEEHSVTSFAVAEDWIKWSPSSGTATFQTYAWGKIIKMQYDADENPDIVYLPKTLSSGVYELAWDMYVGPNNSAYFNVQKYADPGREFGLQVYFQKDQTGRIEIADQQLTFDYVQRKWNRIALSMDFENDWIRLQVNGEEVGAAPLSWQARTRVGTIQFAGVNFYAVDEDSRFWLDDFCLAQGVLSDGAADHKLANNASYLEEQTLKGK